MAESIPIENFPRLITTADLSRETGISQKYLCMLARAGVIPGVKVGKRRWYFSVGQLQEFIAKGGNKDSENLRSTNAASQQIEEEQLHVQ